MNMLTTPIAVCFVGLSREIVGEAIKTQKQIFKKLNALAPSRHQNDKLDLGEWFTKNILLSEEDRLRKNSQKCTAALAMKNGKKRSASLESIKRVQIRCSNPNLIGL